MTSPSIDPLRLHVATFAADALELEGDWAIAELPRLAESECPPDPAAVAKNAESGAAPLPSRSAADLSRRVHWRAVGSLRPVGGEKQVWLALSAGAGVVLQCQRCLLPLAETVNVERQFRFVDDEATAAALDDEMEDEVLALPKSLNLRDLVEDEMLLALPLVPRHDVCPEPLPTSFGDVEAVESEAAHPFAALAFLRKGGTGESGESGEG
jgi:uncharacterized protein